MFLWGTIYYGKVDRVPGHFHVVTCFLHIFWFPIAPCENSSFLVVEGYRRRRGWWVPLSGKSVAFAYLRAVLAVVAAGAVLGALAVWGSPAQSALSREASVALSLAGVVLAIASVAMFRFSYRLSQPSPDRVEQLRRRMQLMAEGVGGEPDEPGGRADDQVAFERAPRRDRMTRRDDTTSREQ
jgi:hypothetical protein